MPKNAVKRILNVWVGCDGEGQPARSRTAVFEEVIGVVDDSSDQANVGNSGAPDGQNDDAMRTAAEDTRELLKIAVDVEMRMRQTQADAITSLRDRSLHLFEIITIGVSIIFAVGFREHHNMPGWGIAMLGVALVSSLLVTCYMSFPCRNWSIACVSGEDLASYAKKGKPFTESLIKELKRSSGHELNNRELNKRQVVFECFLVFLVLLLVVAGSIFIGTVMGD
ncbi:hypothetical protein [Streptomyces sp. NPDC055243]|uniref:hypothetical protein n=1 Tax=Streptomyces sp. NPDC055243 TaxID=3365720 RepID=UPI0037CF1136